MPAAHTRRANQKNWAVGALNDTECDAADPQPLEATPAMRCKNDEVAGCSVATAQ